MKWIIVFDFDGVLVDPLVSVNRAATRAYNELNGTNFKEEFFAKKFEEATHLIRTGKDVLPLMGMIAEGLDTSNSKREEIEKWKQALGEKRVLELEEEYYKRKLENRKLDGWEKTIKPHETAISAFLEIQKKFETWIVTTRDSESIIKFFEKKGVKIDHKKIIDKSFSHDKDKQFKLLKFKTDTEYNHMIFFEDTIYNSLIVQSLGVHVCISTWGFSNKEQWEKARENGIKVITQEEIKPSIRSITGVKL